MKGKQAGLVAAMAVAFLTIGCGKHEGQKLASEAGTVEAGVQERPAALAEATPQAGLVTTAPTVTEPLPAAADSLPPDVVATASALVAQPGQVVEITAQGSTDVTEVIFSDGLKKTPLAYDMEAKSWRAVYRVPMRTKADRVGLAVTATNGQGRWQRVWVFIDVDKGGGKTGSTGEGTEGAEPTDSTPVDGQG
jgi:hypothetical protein